MVFGLVARQKVLNLCCLVGYHIGCLSYGAVVTDTDDPRGVSLWGAHQVSRCNDGRKGC